MSIDTLCPFSKPLIGNWCRCEHARLAERCSGKMVCSRAEDYQQSCTELVTCFRENARFVLGLGEKDSDLTHAQAMKVRCGGLRGMQRVLQLGQETPEVRAVISAVRERYGSVEAFPFNEIVADIREFSHRNKRRD